MWDYVNYVGDGIVGLLSEVQRLPPETAALFRGGSPQTEAKP